MGWVHTIAITKQDVIVTCQVDGGFESEYELT